MLAIYDVTTRELYALVGSIDEVAKDLPANLTVKDLGRDIDQRNERWDPATLSFIARVVVVRDLFQELLVKNEISRLTQAVKDEITGKMQEIIDNGGSRFIRVETDPA